MNTLLELLEKKAEKLPDHIFLTMTGKTYTFSDLRKKSAHIGLSLREMEMQREIELPYCPKTDRNGEWHCFPSFPVVSLQSP